MFTWILIFWIHAGYGVASSTVIFHSQESCQKARDILIAKKPWGDPMFAECFEDKK